MRTIWWNIFCVLSYHWHLHAVPAIFLSSYSSLCLGENTELLTVWWTRLYWPWWVTHAIHHLVILYTLPVILYYTILLYKLKYWENIQYIHKHGYSSVTFSHFTSKLWWYFTYMTIILALLVASFDGDKKYFYMNTLLLY